MTAFCHRDYIGGAAFSCADRAGAGRKVLWRGGIPFLFRRIYQICRGCCCFLRHAGRDQYLFHLCGIYDPAEYAG